jgi:prepilin-type processing-associated H-X9-DG protein
LPALARAKAKAQTASCLGNLRQWGLSIHLYTSDNNDGLPRDGMGQNGLYPGNNYNGFQTGTPNDPAAWFNLLPGLVGDRPLSNYWTSPGTANFSQNAAILPFPGGRGKIWHCPSANMVEADRVQWNGRYGFFSFELNIDLKKRTETVNYGWPEMPKLTSFRKPAAMVLLFDCAFNPRTEIVNGAQEYNSVNPANRWRNFALRHDQGGHLVFVDGHTKFYKIHAVTNGAGSYEAPHPDIIWNAPHRAQHP